MPRQPACVQPCMCSMPGAEGEVRHPPVGNNTTGTRGRGILLPWCTVHRREKQALLQQGTHSWVTQEATAWVAEHASAVCSQVAAGLTTGALGILIASPTDLVKVRMQAEQGGGPKRYPNARAAYGIIVRRAPLPAWPAGVCMRGYQLLRTLGLHAQGALSSLGPLAKASSVCHSCRCQPECMPLAAG